MLQVFGTGRERVALCEDNAQGLVAAAIVTPRNRWVWETFQPSQAPLGAWIQRPGLAVEPLLRFLDRPFHLREYLFQARDALILLLDDLLLRLDVHAISLLHDPPIEPSAVASQ